MEPSLPLKVMGPDVVSPDARVVKKSVVLLAGELFTITVHPAASEPSKRALS
jgi:hypothetical protein